MNRLLLEFRRLYAPADRASDGEAIEWSDLVDADGRSRALVLELARPADWQALSAVWTGVQAELDLPAPAIAANGSDGLQLWFSVVAPLEAVRGHAFLEALRLRYLPGVQRDRVGLFPAGASVSQAGVIGARTPVCAERESDGCWAAFVAPDLAPLFAENPWLDVLPGDDGQAVLLARLECIRPARFDAALDLLSAWAAAATTATAAPGPTRDASRAEGPGHVTGHPQAQAFLLAVMNDDAAPLALRIEAAKALLASR